MIKNIDKMGVLVLMSHLLITLAMIGLYALFAWLGKPVTTIENMLLVIVGYWFGAMGTNQLRASQQTEEVKEEVKRETVHKV